MDQGIAGTRTSGVSPVWARCEPGVSPVWARCEQNGFYAACRWGLVGLRGEHRRWAGNSPRRGKASSYPEISKNHQKSTSKAPCSQIVQLVQLVVTKKLIYLILFEIPFVKLQQQWPHQPDPSSLGPSNTTPSKLMRYCRCQQLKTGS